MTDAELLSLISRGDQKALGILYDRHADLVFRVARRVLQNHELAEDVVQDVFLQVWRRSELYRADRGQVAPWLATIARNRSLDLLRKMGKETIYNEESNGKIVNDAFPQSSLHAAMRKLPRESMEVLMLAYFEDLSQQQIANRLGIPLGTVKSRTRAGLTQLKELYGDE